MLIWILQIERRIEMQEYKIEVVETLSRIISVEAENLEDAIKKVSVQYDSNEIVLDYEDYKGYDILPYEEN